MEDNILFKDQSAKFLGIKVTEILNWVKEHIINIDCGNVWLVKRLQTTVNRDFPLKVCFGCFHNVMAL